jgi:ketosteroid isomerase-like protein
MDATDALIELEQRRVAATNSADAAALGEILADDYVHIGGTGAVMDKGSYIDWVGQLRREHRRTNLRIIDKGDFALIIGDLENHLYRPGGEVQVVHAVVLETALRRDGRWQIHSFQITQKREYS